MADEFGEASLFVDRRVGVPVGMQHRLNIRDIPIDVVFRDWIARDGARLFTRLTITDGDDLYAYQYNHLAFDSLAADATTPEGMREME